MQICLIINIDTAKVTTEELKAHKQNVRDVLYNLEHQLLLRKMAEHKVPVSSSEETVEV